MTSAFSTTRARLTTIQSDADQQMRDEVDQLNSLTQKVADLNIGIANAENTGNSASELRDQRNEAVRQVAELTGARSVEDQHGMVTLTLADGQPLVSGDHVVSLQVQNLPSGLGAIQINGQPAVIGDGRLRGLEDSINAVGAQITSLDDLAETITSARQRLAHFGNRSERQSRC